MSSIYIQYVLVVFFPSLHSADRRNSTTNGEAECWKQGLVALVRGPLTNLIPPPSPTYPQPIHTHMTRQSNFSGRSHSYTLCLLPEEQAEVKSAQPQEHVQAQTYCLITKTLCRGIIIKSDATLIVVNHNVTENRDVCVDFVYLHIL